MCTNVITILNVSWKHKLTWIETLLSIRCPLYETEMLPRARMSPRINNDLHLAYACSVMFDFTQLNNSALIRSYLPRKEIAKIK